RLPRRHRRAERARGRADRPRAAPGRRGADGLSPPARRQGRADRAGAEGPPRSMTGPLAGLRVLDFTQYVAGPYCTMLLRDLGAEVVKVERPGKGDQYRQQGPHFLHGESVTFLALNRNKQSLTLDLKAPRAREIVTRLVPTFDVLVENSRPGSMEELGLGYADLREVN